MSELFIRICPESSLSDPIGLDARTSSADVKASSERIVLVAIITATTEHETAVLIGTKKYFSKF